MRAIACLLAAVSLACSTLRAQMPGILHYQGRVVVGNTNFNGTGIQVRARERRGELHPLEQQRLELRRLGANCGCHDPGD